MQNHLTVVENTLQSYTQGNAVHCGASLNERKSGFSAPVELGDEYSRWVERGDPQWNKLEVVCTNTYALRLSKDAAVMNGSNKLLQTW